MQHDLEPASGRSARRRLAGLVTGASVVLAVGAVHAQQYVNFLPGTYELASTNGSPPPDETLVVTVSGGTATFSLTGAQTASFTLPNDARIASIFGADSVLFPSSSAGSPSWSPATYPYITFWSTRDDGGMTIGSIPGDQGTNYVNNFESNVGTGQVFSAVPEPAGWALMLIGVVGLGAMVRSRRRAPLNVALVN